jgi:uncharacterized membrane protein YbhN (UPF0104 family)
MRLRTTDRQDESGPTATRDDVTDDPLDGSTTEDRADGRVGRRSDLLGTVFVVAAIALAGWALRDSLDDMVSALTRIGWWRLLLSMILVMTGLVITAQCWRAGLAALGAEVSGAGARQIFFPAQVGKYVPGSVWPFLAQIRLARKHGVAAGAALVAGTVFMAVHAVTSTITAALLPLTVPVPGGWSPWIGLAVVPVLALLHPRVLRFAMRKIPKKPDGPEPPELRWSKLVAPIAWMFAAWMAYGAGAYVLAAPFTDQQLRLAVVCTAAFALAWIVGVLVVITPAGVGAREGVLILALSPLIGLPSATSVALLLRVSHTVSDVVAALCYGLLRERR